MTDRSEDFPGLSKHVAPQPNTESNLSIYSRSLSVGLNQIRARASARTLVKKVAFDDVVEAIKSTGLHIGIVPLPNNHFETMQTSYFEVVLVQSESDGGPRVVLYDIQVKDDTNLVATFRTTGKTCTTNSVNIIAQQIAEFLADPKVAELLTNMHLGLLPAKKSSPTTTRGRGVTRIVEGS